ncbi:hypothetical protein [Vibrio parahaemolyticus RIMD 2210633]|uniref:Uncharacterized protein n=2 Tax=Vibrio parahaemolyticus TaxID=670 RepID=Q87KX2_VIBPA|nr:hypothetical protein [Vibrio parahaemolyticus RIMD 2210633]
MPMVMGTVILRSVSGMGALSKPCLSVAWFSGLFFSSMLNIYLVGKLQGYKKARSWASEHFARKPLLSCSLF